MAVLLQHVMRSIPMFGGIPEDEMKAAIDELVMEELSFIEGDVIYETNSPFNKVPARLVQPMDLLFQLRKADFRHSHGVPGFYCHVWYRGVDVSGTRLHIRLPACCVMSGTESSHVSLRVRYAMSGTEIAYCTRSRMCDVRF
eukprot:1955967-Rhodomonas_salina.1